MHFIFLYILAFIFYIVLTHFNMQAWYFILQGNLSLVKVHLYEEFVIFYWNISRPVQLLLKCSESIGLCNGMTISFDSLLLFEVV